ncbi:SpoIIE family protein phosphatase [Actinacidiphila sp. ITFR-21]|uniref:SpoIIE family protein phosphatase n=1 Tax=Actinacidiphila sp. ITFR-21 TaxID=3075199 RepID=UPI00288AB002|nr:SpoIIE family protein phosphatase [Streptomyces sp. ITFR-21]WNI16389.1 SpoIIE family protein phosphatase [Streptomyces sp. ITFR-21]
MFDIGSLTGSLVGAGLVTGDSLRLTESNSFLRDVLGGWGIGQRADDVLTGDRLRPLLDALVEVARGGAPSRVVVAVDEPAGQGAARRYAVVNCSATRSRHGPAVLLLASEFRGPIGVTDPDGVSATRDRTLRRYEALLSAIPQVVWSMSLDGEVDILVGNKGDLGDFQRRESTAEAWMEAVHPKDRVWFAPQWQASADGRAILNAVIRVRQGPQPNQYWHVNIVAVPVMHDGRVTEWIGTATDAETRWRSGMREHLLSRMVALPAAGDLRTALATAASSVVPELVDVFVVFQIQQADRIGFDPRNSAPLSVTRAGMALAEGLPPSPIPDENFRLGPLALRTIEDQQAQRLVFAPGRPPEGELSDGAYAWFCQTQATGLTMMPVVIDGRTVALAGAANCRGNPPPSDADTALLGEVLNELREPLRRTSELETARRTALTLQRSFLTDLPSVEGVEMAAVYQPANTAAEVGGDWYDVTQLPAGSIALTIGDVAGHDLRAATMMGRVNSMLRGIAYDGAIGPAQAMDRLDRALDSLHTHTLITAVHGVATREHDHDHDGWCLTFCNAGHPPLLIVPAHAPARYLRAGDGPDPPLGVSFTEPRREEHCRLSSGDVLILYTDGLVEEPTADITDRLATLLALADAARDAATPDEILTRLLQHVHTPTDDVAVLALRIR